MRLIEGEFVRRHALQQRGALGLLLALEYADLEIEAVRPVAQGDFLAGRRIDAHHLGLAEVGAGERILLGIDDAELARELAGRIVRAADEGAELAELQAEAAVGAGRADARALAAGIVVGREEVGTELLVELVEHFADAQFLGLADGGGEGLPELAQHLVPLGLAARDVVELFLEMRR